MKALIALMIVVGVPSPALGADVKIPDRLIYDDQKPLGMFGTYREHYLQRRWRNMCKGPARYDAMREAMEIGRPNPCQ